MKELGFITEVSNANNQKKYNFTSSFINFVKSNEDTRCYILGRLYAISSLADFTMYFNFLLCVLREAAIEGHIIAYPDADHKFRNKVRNDEKRKSHRKRVYRIYGFQSRGKLWNKDEYSPNISYYCQAELKKLGLITKKNGKQEDDMDILILTPSGHYLLKKISDNISNQFKKKSKKNPSNLFRNRIIYGAPGTGKSYVLNKEAEQYFDSDKQARITFTPNYSFQQFIGAYKPTPIYKDLNNSNIKFYEENNKSQLEIQREPIINYSFVPGIFIKMLIKAIKNPLDNYLILIEEINRANVSAVFGAVFQLLDRDNDHESEYSVEFNTDVTTYLISKNILKNNDSKIKIPSNLFLWSTMNNADQGVLPLDSAFKRRWSFEYISLNKNEEKISSWIINFGHDADGKSICYKWNTFRKEINNILKDNDINEDKLLGPFFMSENHLKNHAAVSNKLLLYLKEDVLKHKSNCLFDSPIKSFGDLMDKYEKDASSIFDSAFREKLKKIECDCKFLDKKIEIQGNDDNGLKYSQTKEGIIAKEKIVSKLDGSYEKINNRGCIVFNGKTAHFYQPAFYETPKEKDRIWTWLRKFDVEYDYVIFDARQHGFIQLPKDIVKKVCSFFDKHALWNSKGSGKLMIYLHKDYEKYGTIVYGSKDYNESIDFTKYLKKL